MTAATESLSDTSGGVIQEWLLKELLEDGKAQFAKTLDKLYLRSKEQSRAGFPDVTPLIWGEEVTDDGDKEDE